MFYVYLIKSVIDNKRRYIGVTADLKKRLQEHNTGKSINTNKHKPWQLVTYIAFHDPIKAEQFESYLKQGSGHAFAKKHLW